MNIKEIYKLLIIVTITVLSWIAYGAYVAATETTIPEFNLDVAKPIDPNLDLEILKSLSSKVYYQSSQ